MAQKTPLPAKTVTYADRWNATWFADLMMFRRKLIEDYHLRFIVTHFLWKKRYLLYLFSLNQNSSCTYLQLAVLPTYERAVVTPMLFPTRPRQKALKEWQTQFNKIKLGALYMLQPVIVDTWEKRLTYEEEQTWLHIMTYFNHTTQAPASWLYLQAFPAVNRSPLLLPKNFLKLKQASALNVDVVLLEKASLELYFFFLDQMKTTQSLVYDGLSYTQHWIQHLPRMLDKAWFNDKNGFSLIKKAIQRLPFVGVWPRSLLNLLVVPKTQSLFKAFPLFTERLNNYLPTYTPYESGLPFRYGPVHLPYRKSGVATQFKRLFSSGPTNGPDAAVYTPLAADSCEIGSQLGIIYFDTYCEMHQALFAARVQASADQGVLTSVTNQEVPEALDPDCRNLIQGCRIIAQAHVRQVLASISPFEVTNRQDLYGRIGEDADTIHSTLVGIYYRVYDEMRQASLAAGVLTSVTKQDPDSLHQHCELRAREHVRQVLRSIPAHFDLFNRDGTSFPL